MRLARYRKAFAAAIPGVLGVVALFIPGADAILSDEQIMAIATLASTALVYAVPNEPM